MVDASSAETIEAELINICIAKGEGNSVADTLRLLSKKNEEWLLLFDSADDISLNLRKYFPRGYYGNIIITSRNIETRVHSPNPRSNVKVTNLTPDDARELLLEASGMGSEVENETKRLATTIVEVCCYVFHEQLV